MWLALKNRPDIAAVTGRIVCIATLSPTKAAKVAIWAWRYLLHNKNCGLWYKNAVGMRDPMHFCGDASLGVGSSRSRTGALVTWGQHVIAWTSCMHYITAWRAFEAQADAGATALEMDIEVRETGRLTTRRPALPLFRDNVACLTNLLKNINITKLRELGKLACAAAGFAIRRSPRASRSITCAVQRFLRIH